MNLMIGATAATVAAVLALLLLLFTQLYCSLFLRRRHNHIIHTATTTNPAVTLHHTPSPSDLRPFYAHGVLFPPRSFLFPAADDDRHRYSDYSGGEDLEASPSSPTVEQLMMMYNISNPIYDEGGVKAEEAAAAGGGGTGTPPMSPMKMVPPEWPSVLGTDSNAAVSSSSSPSSSTSPSW